jgi:predicted O-methyltransferase YrrM
MVSYDLSHLVQPNDEAVLGPVQDTEALFLYAVVRGMRMRRVLEIGGLSGYSARNFLAALPADGERAFEAEDSVHPEPGVREREIDR